MQTKALIKNTRKPLLAVAVLALVALAAIGYGDTAAQTPASAPVIPSSTRIPGTRAEEPPTQVKILREYTDQLLATVRWTIGIAITLTVFIAGLGWYANFRIHERDRQAMKADLLDELGELTRESFSSQDQHISTKLNEYSQQVEAHKTEFDERIKSSIEEALAQVDDEIQSLRRQVLVLNYELLKQKAEFWRAKGVQTNVLRTHMSMLGLAGQLGWDWRMSKALEGIVGALDEGATPDADDVRELTAMLSALPQEYAVLADVIRSRLS